MDSNFLRQFRSARQCSAPLIAVKTPDPAATISAVVAQETKNGEQQIPVITWDCIRGFWAADQQSRTALANLLGQRPPASVVVMADALNFCSNLPDRSIVFALNAHRHMDTRAIQAIWNLRDIFPGKGCTLVLLGPDFTLPAEISGDVLPLEEPLPDSGEIRTIITSVYSDAQKQVVSLPSLTDPIVTQAVKACSGLASFPVNQSVAMSISKSGLDVDALWKRKKDQIEQTPGLSVWSGANDFANVKDCDNVIGFLKRYLPKVSTVVFLDEFGDAMAGTDSDSSGVSQKMHGALLSYMEDHNVPAILFVGHGGTGKSEVAKCCSEGGKRPVISFDLPKMESRYVGDSTARLHAALQTVTATSTGGYSLFVATTNSTLHITAQMRRRFKKGIFFFDLPSKSGRTELWKYYTSKFGLTVVEKPGFDDTGWTGAEIRNCCENSSDLEIPLTEASTYISPLVRTAAEKIEAMNREADGRFISAAYSGPYSIDKTKQIDAPKLGRKFNSQEN